MKAFWSALVMGCTTLLVPAASAQTPIHTGRQFRAAAVLSSSTYPQFRTGGTVLVPADPGKKFVEVYYHSECPSPDGSATEVPFDAIKLIDDGGTAHAPLAFEEDFARSVGSMASYRVKPQEGSTRFCGTSKFACDDGWEEISHTFEVLKKAKLVALKIGDTQIDLTGKKLVTGELSNWKKVHQVCRKDYR